jgi:predicted DNA-binding transcriptional regulator AlpA
MRIWSVVETAAVLGVSRTTLWRWVGASHFPPPLQLGPTAGSKRGWPRFVGEDWLLSRLARHDSSARGAAR